MKKPGSEKPNVGWVKPLGREAPPQQEKPAEPAAEKLERRSKKLKEALKGLHFLLVSRADLDRVEAALRDARDAMEEAREAGIDVSEHESELDALTHQFRRSKEEEERQQLKALRAKLPPSEKEPGEKPM